MNSKYCCRWPETRRRSQSWCLGLRKTGTPTLAKKQTIAYPFYIAVSRNVLI